MYINILPVLTAYNFCDVFVIYVYLLCIVVLAFLLVSDRKLTAFRGAREIASCGNWPSAYSRTFHVWLAKESAVLLLPGTKTCKIWCGFRGQFIAVIVRASHCRGVVNRGDWRLPRRSELSMRRSLHCRRPERAEDTAAAATAAAAVALVDRLRSFTTQHGGNSGHRLSWLLIGTFLLFSWLLTRPFLSPFSFLSSLIIWGVSQYDVQLALACARFACIYCNKRKHSPATSFHVLSVVE